MNAALRRSVTAEMQAGDEAVLRMQGIGVDLPLAELCADAPLASIAPEG